jgi:ATP-binding cassette subfamily B protein
MVDEFVSSNIMAYDMLLEENGFNLSGGQRQRIILARAMLKDANIYILDESLNEVDIEKERQILTNLFNNYPDKTFIVISHRFHNQDLFNKKYQIKEGVSYEE